MNIPKEVPIVLPPLPEPQIESRQTDGAMRTLTLHTFSSTEMQEYATAAIAADRELRAVGGGWCPVIRGYTPFASPAVVPSDLRDIMADIDAHALGCVRKAAGEDLNTNASMEIVRRGIEALVGSPAVDEWVRKALEFAEYLAKGAEQLLDAVNVLAEVRESDEDGEIEPRAEHEAETTVSEYMSGLRSDIYEFRKRRDRCDQLSTAATPSAVKEQLTTDGATGAKE